MKKVVIIGAGIGGIATAALLAKRGYDVSVFEQHDEVGGRAGQFELAGFTFDTGPSWYLMPEVFENFFELLGEDIHDHLTLKRLDPAYKVFFEGDKPPLTITGNLTTDAAAFEAIEAGAGTKLAAYVERSETVYRLAMKHFLYTNFSRISSLVQPEIIRHTFALLRDMVEPIHRLASRTFRDQRLQQILEYPMVFLGTSPFQAPSLYRLMSYLDFKQGVFYPAGGIHTVIAALEAIAIKQGVHFYYGKPVTSIQCAKERAKGILLADGSTVDADIVISNADLHFTETALLAPEHQTYPSSYWKRKQPSPSAILMYLGIKGSLPSLEHHNLFFVDRWKENFAAIFERQDWAIPGSLYVCKPSQTDPTVAPSGHENIFVLVPGPAQLEDSNEAIAMHTEAYLDQIARMANIPDLKKRIVTKRIVGPRYFSEQFNAWDGTALGLSHVLTQSAFFRPPNKSRKLDNLYYVGANTMPGIGLPMCLISAQLVAERLEAPGGTS